MRKSRFFRVRRTISPPRWIVVAGCVSERVCLFFRSAGISHRSIRSTCPSSGLARSDQCALDGKPVLGSRNYICIFFRLHRLPSVQKQFEFICVASSCTAPLVELNFMAAQSGSSWQAFFVSGCAEGCIYQILVTAPFYAAVGYSCGALIVSASLTLRRAPAGYTP